MIWRSFFYFQTANATITRPLCIDNDNNSNAIERMWTATCVVWSTQRAVSFDGSNVDFGNPLYNTTNDDKIDTTPAYDDGDKKYMPGIGELASQTYIKGNVDNLSTDA